MAGSFLFVKIHFIKWNPTVQTRVEIKQTSLKLWLFEFTSWTLHRWAVEN